VASTGFGRVMCARPVPATGNRPDASAVRLACGNFTEKRIPLNLRGALKYTYAFFRFRVPVVPGQERSRQHRKSLQEIEVGHRKIKNDQGQDGQQGR